MRYKLTTAGKAVCIILAILLAAVVYFTVVHFFMQSPSGENKSHISGQNPDDPQKPGLNNEPATSGSSLTPTPYSISIPLDGNSDSLSEALNTLYDPLDTRLSVYFDPESSELTVDAKKILNQFIDENNGLVNYCIVLEANCATTIKGQISEAVKNEHKQLAQSRADAVKNYLSDNLLNSVVIKNLGADNPNNDNSTYSKRSANRRVDIYLYMRKEQP